MSKCSGAWYRWFELEYGCQPYIRVPFLPCPKTKYIFAFSVLETCHVKYLSNISRYVSDRYYVFFLEIRCFENGFCNNLRVIPTPVHPSLHNRRFMSQGARLPCLAHKAPVIQAVHPYPLYWSALIYVKCCIKWFGKNLKITLIIFFFCLFSTTEIISTSARVFATSAHQVQVKTAVVLDAASVISTCSYCDEVSAKLSSSVENIHANTTVTGYALSSIRQLVPNTGKYRSCRLFIIYLFATQN